MTWLRLLFLSPLLLAAHGCITMSNVDPRVEGALDKDSSAVFIVGIAPEYRIHVSRGTQRPGGWAVDQWSFVAVNAFPTRGYLVAKVKPRTGDDSYGVTAVLPDGIGLGPMFSACSDSDIPTFEAAAGKVVYVGDLAFETSGNEVRMRYSSDADRMRAALGPTYPNLVSRMEQSKITFQKATNISCTRSTVTVPIYVPK